MDDTKYITFRGQSIELKKNNEGFYEDSYGTIYAFTDSGSSVDSVNRCGVGVFSLSANSPLTDACTPHDVAYSSPVYQAFHTRQEADFYLKYLAEQITGTYSITPELFFFLSRELGSQFWENKSTND